MPRLRFGQDLSLPSRNLRNGSAVNTTKTGNSGVAILPFVLGRDAFRLHMFPYGKKDRPIYAGASLAWAKESCGLVPFDFPGFGLRARERVGWVDCVTRPPPPVDALGGESRRTP